MKNLILLFLSLFFFNQLGIGQSKLYFANEGNGTINIVNEDGTGFKEILRETAPGDLVHDHENGKLYFTDPKNGTLNVLTLNSQVSILAEGLTTPTGLYFDKTSQTFYITEREAGKIISMSADGSNKTEIISGLSNPYYIFFAENEGKIYWTDFTDNTIYKINPDGSDRSTVYNDAFRCLEIHVDEDGGYVYWIQSCGASSCNGIWRVPLSGGTKQQITDDSARGIGFDPVNKKVYWGEPIFNNIHRSNLDGTNEEDVLSNGSISFVTAISLAVDQGILYYLDFDKADLIHKVNTDGSDREVLFTSQLYSPLGIYVDEANQKLYWVNSVRSDRRGEDVLMTSDLDGKNITPLEATMGQVSGARDITIDHKNQKMYWTDPRSEKIYRSDLDGSNGEAIIEFMDIQAFGICVDPSTEKIYWADPFANKVQKANLDGSDIEDLFDFDDGLDNPNYITIDTINQKIYWTESSKGFISKSNTDGTDLQIIFDPMSSFEGSGGIDYDYESGNLFFNNTSRGHVQKYDATDQSITQIITITERFHRLSDVQFLFDVNSDVRFKVFDQLEIFPNPTSDFLNIHNLDFDGEILIYSLSGNVFVRQQFTESDIQMDLGGLAAGTYFVKVLDKKGNSKAQPFVVTK